MNNTNIDFIIDPSQEILSIENTAEVLEVSTATVRNWIKCRFLPAHNKNNKYFLYKTDVENIKSKFLQGEIEKLNKRANKMDEQS